MNLETKWRLFTKHIYGIMSVMVIVSMCFFLSKVHLSEAQTPTAWINIAQDIPIRAAHINELRTQINARLGNCINPSACWIPDFVFGAPITAGDIIRKGHIDDIRTATRDLIILYGDSPVPFGIQSNLAANSQVQASHFINLQAAIDSAKYCGDLNCDAPEACDICLTDCGTCSVCGNGTREGVEVCDAPDLDGQSCATLFPGGAGILNCNADCLSFDTSGCVYCGDGIKNGTEECDGSDFGIDTCSSVGPFQTGGTLGCLASCLFDTTGCIPICNNDTVCDTDDGENNTNCPGDCPAIDGICDNSVRNGCSAGTPNDGAIPDTATEYRWQCDGLNGGSNSGMCSLTSCISENVDCTMDPLSCCGSLSCEPIGGGFFACQPPVVPVNGVCNNSVRNGCIEGTPNDGAIPDTSTEYRWRCDGQNGGLNSSMCSSPSCIPENTGCSLSFGLPCCAPLSCRDLGFGLLACQPPLTCNNNGSCDIGENNDNCPNDCCGPKTPCWTTQGSNYCFNDDRGWAWRSVANFTSHNCGNCSKVCNDSISCGGGGGVPLVVAQCTNDAASCGVPFVPGWHNTGDPGTCESDTPYNHVGCENIGCPAASSMPCGLPIPDDCGKPNAALCGYGQDDSTCPAPNTMCFEDNNGQTECCGGESGDACGGGIICCGNSACQMDDLCS